MSKLFRAAAFIAALLPSLSAFSAASSEPPFHFEVQEGRNLNEFLRAGPTAAHLVLRSGENLRVLVAFPAGNSGVGLWFQPQKTAAQWFINSPLKVSNTQDAAGRSLYGVSFDASIALASLAPKQAILSSVRVLRDYEYVGTVPPEVGAHVGVAGNKLTWSRDRLDGAAGYRLVLEVIGGKLHSNGEITAGTDGLIKLRIAAFSGETPLTPLSGATLLDGKETHSAGAANTLTFLSYKEKFLAGSWRFNTYFGRDTLMSVRLLMPVLAPDAIEAGMRSVLERLSADGEVAHEEGIGEFAVLAHKKENGSLSDAPVLDYRMIDGNYLLAPVMAQYLLDNAQGRRRAENYLYAVINGTAKTSAGKALVRNLRLVVSSAQKFASQPRYENLISLKAGVRVGEWRDSESGLGGGRYPYDVNAVLVPAALEATARLVRSDWLGAFMTAADRELLGHAAPYAKAWRQNAPHLFDMTMDNDQAHVAIESYAKQVGVSDSNALAALDKNGVNFHAISLDAAGKPVPIVHSDEGFELLFVTPEPAALDRDVESVMRPFPLGLMTDVGMLVANPAFAAPALQDKFSNHAYHGTVVWSWQQALFASGLARQLQRKDLPQPVKQHLMAAQQTLWKAIRATHSVQSSELWSWQFSSGHYDVVPFGASGTDADESNAAQLWSSVYLSVRAP